MSFKGRSTILFWYDLSR